MEYCELSTVQIMRVLVEIAFVLKFIMLIMPFAQFAANGFGEFFVDPSDFLEHPQNRISGTIPLIAALLHQEAFVIRRLIGCSVKMSFECLVEGIDNSV
jgi:hypothetical protein